MKYKGKENPGLREGSAGSGVQIILHANIALGLGSETSRETRV